MTEYPVTRLEQADSTNNWVKRHFAEMAPVQAVWTQNQTAGRGRLGRAWENLPGAGFYYTVAIKTPLAQPSALPLYASLAVAEQLRLLAGADVRVKWPNDLLLNGKKLVGILCEGVPGGYLCGVGVNLAHPAEYFERTGLAHGTSLAREGAKVPDAALLAQSLTACFGEKMARFAAGGFAPLRSEYKAACVNLGREVWFDGGTGVAADVDDEGRLVVRTAAGETAVFTGEVSVKGIYGRV